MSKIYEKDFNNETLRKLQLTELEILDEIVRICEKFDIHYYLVGGTLLGAVRHKGFIPWDDDLDIAMPREDYDRFCELCKTQLDNKYLLHDINYDNKYWLMFAKVRKKGTLLDEKNIEKIEAEKGIFVDVFPLDEVAVEKKYFRTHLIKGIGEVILRKRGVVLSKSLKKAFFAFMFAPFSINFLTKIQLYLMKMDNGKGYLYYINYGSNYKTLKQTIPKDKYEPYKLEEFEGKQYHIPNDEDYVLRRIYNDYMKLPPEEDRILRHKPKCIDFGKIEAEEE